MKILFSASTYPHPGYPFSAFISVLCEELTRQGHEVTVIAPQSIISYLIKGTKLLPLEITYNVTTEHGMKDIKVYRPYSYTFGHGRFLRLTWWANQRAFSRIVKKRNICFDIIYAHFWNNGYNALTIEREKGKPLFVATGEDCIIANKILTVSKINDICNNTRGVICVSTKNKIESITKGLTTEKKCIVLPNAIDPQLFYKKDKQKCRTKLGFPADAFIVAYSGRFAVRKGVNRVSSAITLLNDNNIKSIFIGSNYGNEIVQPECNGILFKGKLKHEDMVDYLNSADVFVLPSLAEGCSNSIIEAMACGLPIISSDLPFNHDILNENNAILVDPNNVEQIADTINLLKNNEVLRIKLAEGALASAKELTIGKRAARIVAFIKEILKGEIKDV
ncbi:MAG: glycosyltransferase family 4 protein [Prevotella ruminicola]|uniref:Glycosyltransferase family 4 protein n=1 Tax=Xylanibacter ruminicola TaxID=839 RepID=A0A9D5P0B0_XYLRU|nr:glycosyltransferase family 4 protein [Xylanibacter ruminicola]